MSDQDFITDEATEDVEPSEHSQDSASAGEAVTETASGNHSLDNSGLDDDRFRDHEHEREQGHEHGPSQDEDGTSNVDAEHCNTSEEDHDDPDNDCEGSRSEDYSEPCSSIGNENSSGPRDDSDESA